jgi:hypothetical protein
MLLLPSASSHIMNCTFKYSSLNDDLIDELYEKYFVNREATDADLERHKLNRLEMMSKELQFRIDEYDEQNEQRAYCCSKEVVQLMAETERMLHENITWIQWMRRPVNYVSRLKCSRKMLRK